MNGPAQTGTAVSMVTVVLALMLVGAGRGQAPIDAGKWTVLDTFQSEH